MPDRYTTCVDHKHAAAGTALLHHAVGWDAPDPAHVTTVLRLTLLIGCRVTHQGKCERRAPYHLASMAAASTMENARDLAEQLLDDDNPAGRPVVFIERKIRDIFLFERLETFFSSSS